MAKANSRSRGRSKNFVVLKVHNAQALTTLANDTVSLSELLNIEDDVRLISADLTWSLHELTPGEGPILVGLTLSSLTAAQVLEAIDASPTNRGDRIALERTSRPVRDVGSFPGVAASEVLADGRPIRTKLRFKMSENQNLEQFAVNRSGAALTTGALLEVSGKVFAEWT